MQAKKILLVDVDSKIPNIALMKLSSYYKNKGYLVDLISLFLPYYPGKQKENIIDAKDYEQVFVSIIFKINKPFIKVINCDNITYGGVGYSLTNKLPEEIEQAEKDYSIYPDNKVSIGYITRGCIRNCPFCVVPKKEGMIHQVNTVKNIIKHKHVIFLDNNILAFKGHIDILKELKKLQVRCDFKQGLDIRLLTPENSKLLSELNYIKEYYFAFDNIKDKDLIEKKHKLFRQYMTIDWNIKMFLYCHPDMDILTDLVDRIKWCKDNKVLPYIMRDISCWNSDNKNLYTDLAAWCNQPGIFKKMKFSEFMEKRTPNKERIKNDLILTNNIL